MKQQIALLGSTGSIGEQTLDIIRENCELFNIHTLTAHSNWERLSQQAKEFNPHCVVIACEEFYAPLKEALKATPVKVYAGERAIEECVKNDDIDCVVNALVGYAGLRPTVSTLESGKRLALANKESLVVGGDYVMKIAREKGLSILPIDSEHSAIFQCLLGECSPIRRLIITCSGGALRECSIEELKDVTPERALRHPQWQMGNKITIDSATLVNKGFEVIEAHWLFGVPAERIDVVIHPQSIIHSMVEFEDGAIKAQLGSPDMHMPISLALMYPQRAVRPTEHFSLLDNPLLKFSSVDHKKYPALGIAYECLRRKGNSACIMNGANEVAVSAFLNHQCRYPQIVGAIEYALNKGNWIEHPTLDDYAQSNIEARELAREYLNL